MKFTLRPYQLETIELLRQTYREGSKRPILCLPTGAGKTVTFSQIADAAIKKGNKVLVVCHRKELIEQAQKTMQAYGVDMSGVSFGMVQTFVRSPEKIPDCNLCIIDECMIGNFRRFIEILPDTVKILGATATPISASKKNPLRKTFTNVVSPVSIQDLINKGYLAKPTHKVAMIDESNLIKGSNGEFTTESLDKTYTGLYDNVELAWKQRRGKTIIFCSSIKTSVDVAARLGAYVVHSKMPDQERDEIISAFKASKDGTIVNCGILTAGFDDPIIQTVIVFRATTSLILWLQMCGRGSRVIPNVKDRFLIYDLGNNYQRHGLWHEERDWERIFQNEGKRKTAGEAPYKTCVNEDCKCLILASAKVCPMCGKVQPVKTKKTEKVKTFVDIAYETGKVPTALKKPSTAQQLLDRAAIGSIKTKKPYSMGWVMHQLKKMERWKAYKILDDIAEIKGYRRGWTIHQRRAYNL